MRRFTRLTNGFSKKVDNRKAMIALHYMHYNFTGIQKTFRAAPGTTRRTYGEKENCETRASPEREAMPSVWTTDA